MASVGRGRLSREGFLESYPLRSDKGGGRVGGLALVLLQARSLTKTYHEKERTRAAWRLSRVRRDGALVSSDKRQAPAPRQPLLVATRGVHP